MLTVRRQLSRLVMVVIGAVVLLMSAAFFTFEYVAYRNDTVAFIYPLAASIGLHLRADLGLGNAQGAHEVLATAQDNRQVLAIYLFDRNNLPFTYFKRPVTYARATDETIPERLLERRVVEDILASDERTYRFEKGYLAVFFPILDGKQKAGTLYLVVSLAPFYQRMLLWIACALPIMAAAVALGLYLAGRLQQGIVAPLSQLVAHMERVADEDLREPVALNAPGELGRLVDGFNAMLARVASHEQTLRELNAGLEERVSARTADLARSEAKYRSLFEDSPAALWEQDFSLAREEMRRMQQAGVSDMRLHLLGHPEEIRRLAGLVKVIDVNRQAVSLYGAVSKREMLGGLDTLLDDNALAGFAERLAAVAEGRLWQRFEGSNRRKSDGAELSLSIYWTVVPGYEVSYGRVLVSLLDITERRRMEQQLLASLEEKETLIREVHHRVKNNLQVISSLLRLQLKQVRDPAAAAEMQVALQRIRSIALVHERLYRSPDDLPDLQSYLGELARELCAIYGLPAERVRVEVELSGVAVSFDAVTSLVMIANELLTNALKHAFTPGVPGIVRVTLRQVAGQLELSVQDDGIGLPPGWAPASHASLGLTLVDSLAAQIDGTVSFAGGAGTRITVTCPLAA